MANTWGGNGFATYGQQQINDGWFTGLPAGHPSKRGGGWMGFSDAVPGPGNEDPNPPPSGPQGPTGGAGTVPTGPGTEKPVEPKPPVNPNNVPTKGKASQPGGGTFKYMAGDVSNKRMGKFVGAGMPEFFYRNPYQ